VAFRFGDCHLTGDCLSVHGCGQRHRLVSDRDDGPQGAEHHLRGGYGGCEVAEHVGQAHQNQVSQRVLVDITTLETMGEQF